MLLKTRLTDCCLSAGEELRKIRLLADERVDILSPGLTFLVRFQSFSDLQRTDSVMMYEGGSLTVQPGLASSRVTRFVVSCGQICVIINTSNPIMSKCL